MEPTEEEKTQAMEEMECWKSETHLKHCTECGDRLRGKLAQLKIHNCDTDTTIFDHRDYYTVSDVQNLLDSIATINWRNSKQTRD